jgi:hypothetical protein
LICINAEHPFTFDCPFAKRETPMSTNAIRHCLTAGLLGLICGFGLAGSPAASQPAKPDRITIEYLAPTNPALKKIYERVRDARLLEKVREILLPVQWPQTLKMEFRDCGGEADAGYENAVITVCYELLDDFWRSAKSGRPPVISREDAFAGQSLNVLLHEGGHAMFRLLKIPVLGREEDAADQISAYYLLQFPKERRQALILGSAYAFASQLNIRRPRDLYRLRLQLGRHVAFSGEHGTTAQRLYNVLCLAYGSDKELFGDIVKSGFLPEERAVICEEEYRQVDFAYRTLILPHVDSSP